MTSITGAAADILAAPAPVVILDTCTLLDLFRWDAKERSPRAQLEELSAASDLRTNAGVIPRPVHLILPELVPGEYADHAARIEAEFDGWVKAHDENRTWLTDASALLGGPVVPPAELRPFALHRLCRRLADDLLAAAVVLDRDGGCLNRAVARLIAKRRPSHSKEMKDSMSLEQTLELGRQLRQAAFALSVVFISSNTADFAAPKSSALHPDLQGEFAGVGVGYFTSIRAALGELRTRGEIR